MIGSIDITNAYFHGESLDRLLLMSLPKGGIPDNENVNLETALLRELRFTELVTQAEDFGKS